jgi:Ca2+-dependent lipid-binding protein
MSQSYTLQGESSLSIPSTFSTQANLLVRGAAEIQWASTLFHKTPSLYVEINVDQVMQRTRVIKRNLTPVWDETLTLLVLIHSLPT